MEVKMSLKRRTEKLQTGATLLELVVALGISAIAALYIGQLGLQMQQASRMSESHSQISSFISHAQTLFSIRGVCLNNIQKVEFEGFDPIEFEEPIIQEIDGGGERVLMRAGGDEEVVKGMRIKRLAFRLASPTQAFFHMTFEDKKTKQEITRSVPLMVETTEPEGETQRVTKCNLALMNSGEEHDMSLVCNGAGTTYYVDPDTGKDYCFHTGFSTVPCPGGQRVVGFMDQDLGLTGGGQPSPMRVPVCALMPPGAGGTLNCGANQVLKGINADGTLNCVALTIGDLENYFTGNSFSSCAGEPNRSFAIDSGSINLICPP